MRILFLMMFIIPRLVFAQFDESLMNQFINEYAAIHKADKTEVMSIIKNATFQPSVIEKISRPAEGEMTWERYRSIFLKEDRINSGVAFWKTNRTALELVSKDTGVPIEIMIGILGVETKFGNIKGDYLVLDALATLAFGYPRRSSFFKSELDEFLTLCKKENLDPFSVKGSYAGAMGYAQFMPSSYRAYAVSFDENGTRDLMNSVEDAIASVANYLKVHRWQQGEPVALEGTATKNAEQLGNQSVKPSNTINYYLAKGYAPNSDIDGDTKASLQVFEMQDQNPYWFCFYNFYVITRYNHSSLYAMAVYQLGNEIKKRLAENPN